MLSFILGCPQLSFPEMKEMQPSEKYRRKPREERNGWMETSNRASLTPSCRSFSFLGADTRTKTLEIAVSESSPLTHVLHSVCYDVCKCSHLCVCVGGGIDFDTEFKDWWTRAVRKVFSHNSPWVSWGPRVSTEEKVLTGVTWAGL